MLKHTWFIQAMISTIKFLTRYYRMSRSYHNVIYYYKYTENNIIKHNIIHKHNIMRSKIPIKN